MRVRDHRCVLTGTGRHFLEDLFQWRWPQGITLAKKKRKDRLPLLLLIFPLLFFLFQAFNSYPAWKNLPDCIKPDATGIFHFLMRSRVNRPFALRGNVTMKVI